MTTIVIVGGTSGIGREIARRHAAEGEEVIVTGRDASRAATAAKEVGAARGLALDLTRPEEIAAALAEVERVDHLVLAAIERDQNTAADYRLDDARRLTTLKLVGYTEVVHALLPRMSRDGAVVVFGGLAKERPYPGSTMVSAVNGAVVGLVHTLAVELAPIRVNGVHPGIVGDSPYWRDKPLDAVVSRTPTGRLATMDDIADAVSFLLRNRSVNGVNLNVDGGWLLT
ncbi:short-chain dehydrogenase [Actinomadura rubrobrunea]|uniref:Short-chain dehydrogenase n=1 Tax=Actinomadura rubrobrunea TaxID=115335 RepID=A0A9W6PVR9_9ACTN|nr:SDR family oxidoreductase [Actinomadura rubrobrunea]GLW63818.1 short-chain dehydrogenase [Actinomadura rubrobrunea]